MSIDNANAVEQPRRHHKYYFTFIIFEVEKVLFKVPRHPFEDESELFKDMFALPPGGDRLPDGSSDPEPFVLHDVTVKDFEALLKVLLPDPCGASNSLSQEEWISVLRLSHKWTFDRLFKLATQELEKFTLNPVTKITIAKTYSITSWLKPAYFLLATREQPLTLEEASELGLDTVVKLNVVRDFHYRWIIEDGNAEHPQAKTPQHPISNVPYYERHVKKKTCRPVVTDLWGGRMSVNSSTTLDYEETELLNEEEAACLELAVNTVSTELFGLK